MSSLFYAPHNQAFAINRTLIHAIDDQSQLKDFTDEGLVSSVVWFFLSFQARDPALGAIVHDWRTDRADAIRPGFHYADMVTFDADGRTVGDLRQISMLEPDDPI